MSGLSSSVRPPTPHRAPPVRAALIILGTFFLAVGAVGAVVPVLPTTPFVLLAAACYLRSSTRLHGRLLRSPKFGPTIAAWEERRALRPQTKVIAIVMVVATFAISIAFAVEDPLLRVALGILGVVLVVWLARRPSWAPPVADTTADATREA
jgi:uncharacterized membrane protein YbaN (DUF454 family)